ncbi:protein kinase domain-containing protein [Thermodesulfitimonas autotrophica]|uniref:protein kinase domain-containing protein n=1 Tax=Thermodesulfitimonas autotrophica TaxID=1894989 RepID=UPI002FDFCEE0
MIGRVIGNRYRIIEELGGGGMAVVYLGQDMLLNRNVTLKVLREEYARDEDFVRRFRQEARAVASLSHPNIVSVFDVGQDSDLHYLVMEYVDGTNLKTLIKEGKLDLRCAVSIARDLCDALGHAHRRGIVHRDVKPHNIIVTPEGRAKLTDFGIARAVGSGTISATKALMGSVQYISPEQARGENADARSDIYSLGAVLYEMLTGRPPFLGENPVALAIKHIQDQPTPVRELNPGVPAALATVVEKAMAKNPALRYQSVAAIAADLGRILESLPAEDCPVGSTARLPRKRRLRPAGYVILGLVLLAVLMAGWWGFRCFMHVPEVTVPDVQGMEVSAATQVLEKNGLRWQIQEVHDASVEKGKIIKQDLVPGSRVKKGRLLILVVSLGPEMRTVPDVRHKLLQDAEILLVNEGFNIGQKKEVYSDTVAAGLVVDQDPAPGLSRPKDSPVDLFISKGPRPVLKSVPQLVGLSLEVAKEAVVRAGFVLGEEIAHTASTDYLAGYICAQNPPAGTNLELGRTITVTVSDGPGPAPREASVFLQVPDDGQQHTVRITVDDARGATEAYNAVHQGGERVVQPVVYYGKATIRVYLDGQMVREQTLS